MEHKDDKGNILIYQSQDETIAQRGCSFCSLVPGVFLTILVCFAAWGISPLSRTSRAIALEVRAFYAYLAP